jgi:voltage-gated potassium channel
LEYFLRIISIRKPWKYIFSFYGLIDLLAIVPSYISLFVAGSQYLLIVRVLRLIRIFRVLKLARYLGEAKRLVSALKASRPKITVFLVVVMTSTIVVGSIMYLIEGEANGYTSIPRSIYWAVVTMTTVGYGDITPHTVLGQTLSAFLMILGYGLIAVPTGIVSAELVRSGGQQVSTQACPSCSREGHDPDAEHCKFCGEKL